MEVSLWNAGPRNINGDEIRRPLVISLAGVERILDIQNLKVDEKDGLEISKRANPFPEVELKWKYLDRNTGFKFAIVFTANGQIKPRAQIFYDGDIVETNYLRRSWWRIGGTIISFFIVIAICVFFQTKLPRQWRFISIIALVITIITASCLMTVDMLPAKPPF